MAEDQENQAPDGEEAPAVDSALAEAQSAIDEMRAEADAATIAAGGGQRASVGHASGNLDLLGDVDLHVSIELGRTEMLVEDVLRLGEGSVVELDKLAGDPVDVYVNGRLIARGEVLVLNDNFCIRVSEIVANLEEQAAAAAQSAAT